MYAVLDTCTLVSGLRSRAGASHQVLREILSGRIRIALSVALALEYEAVCMRPGIVPSLTPLQITAVVDSLCRLGDQQKIFYTWRPFLPDADDDMVLELAVAAEASVIITHNGRDFRGSESYGIRAYLLIDPGECHGFLKLRFA